MLSIKNVTFHAETEEGTLPILNDITLDIAPHRFVVITGPNGGGKTTLAKAVMGIVTPTSGSIVWNGEDITALDITQRAQRGIAFGFQAPPRFKGLKVHDLLNIAAGRDLLHAEASELLTRVGLQPKEYINRDVDASLSGGEVKRVEIASVLARDAELLIFDEPEAGIDLWSFVKLTSIFEQLRAQGDKTILIISHQERIINMADEILVIADGAIDQFGTRDEILPKIMASTMENNWLAEGGR